MSQKTPSPKASSRTLQGVLQSTPLSGSGSQNTYAGNPDNKRRMAIDLENTVEVSLPAMIAALLARPGLALSETPEDPDLVKASQEQGKLALNNIIAKAIGFCNSRSERSNEMKNYLRAYLNAETEEDSYQPLASFFNTILLYTEGSPASTKSDDDLVIFVPNHRTVISSKKEPSRGDSKEDTTVASSTKDLSRGESKGYPTAISSQKDTSQGEHDTKRKPDIVGLPVSYLLSQGEQSNAQRFAKLASQIATEKEPACKPKNIPWSHILVATEVKHIRDRKRDLKRLDLDYAQDCLNSLTKETKARSNTSGVGTGSRKRKAAEDPEEPALSKRSGKALSSTAARSSTPIRVPSPAVQCGYYGLERLRCAWNATHGYLLFVDGVKLQLQYYDPQGLIRTHHVSLLDHLPVVVAMFVMFRSLSGAMWGVPRTELSFEHKTNKVTIPFELAEGTETHQSFHWIGRRTFTADVRWTSDSRSPITAGRTRSATKSKDPDPDAPGYTLGSSFFKASWPESSRDKEPDIVAEALDRAEKHLGPYTSYVVDHVPTIHGSGELEQSSTAIIRKLLDCDPAITARSRVLLWMTSRKLAPLTEQETPRFFAGFIQLIRCHFLLWRIGIAHGDISLRNLMYDPDTKKGILNDFDLAATMDPGALSPPQKGHQRSGTIPFMALALLENNVPRVYAHDLEAFVWCLFWHCADVSEAEMQDKCPDYAQTLNFKARILGEGPYEFQSKPSCVGVWGLVRWWMKLWQKHRAQHVQAGIKKVHVPDDVFRVDVPDHPESAAPEPESEERNSAYMKECWPTFIKVPIDDNPGWIDFSVVQKATTSC